MLRTAGISRQWGQRGLTMLETILVVSVIVAATAILLPNVLRLGEADRLTRAADQMRAVLTGLRLRAIEESRPFQISLRPGSADYVIGSPALERNSAGAADDEFAGNDQCALGEHTLEEGVRFERSAPNAAGNNSSDGQPADGTLSAWFFPDGSATDLAFSLAEGSGPSLPLEIRGLTGIVEIARSSTVPVTAAPVSTNATAQNRGP